MSETPDATDDELLALLADAVAEADAVPERRAVAARAAFAWRTIDAELAELLHDSALDAGAAVRSAGDEAPRSLSFGSGGLGLEVDVDGPAVMGQVLGTDLDGATVTLQRTGAEDRVTDVDSAGFFGFSEVASGPVRLLVVAAGWRLVSPWVVL